MQAVFSSTPPTIGAQIRFTPSERTNEIATATIEYTANLPNPVTGSEDVMTVYLQDTLAWATNLVFEQNLLTGNSLKPSTYNIYRNPPIEWFLGAPGLGSYPQIYSTIRPSVIQWSPTIMLLIRLTSHLQPTTSI